LYEMLYPSGKSHISVSGNINMQSDINTFSFTFYAINVCVI